MLKRPRYLCVINYSLFQSMGHLAELRVKFPMHAIIAILQCSKCIVVQSGCFLCTPKQNCSVSDTSYVRTFNRRLLRQIACSNSNGIQREKKKKILSASVKNHPFVLNAQCTAGPPGVICGWSGPVDVGGEAAKIYFICFSFGFKLGVTIRRLDLLC